MGDFNGSDYEPELDKKRLTGQILRIYELMRDGRYRTLDEIARLTGDPAASISAQLRNLRKERFGSHTVLRQRRGDRTRGLFEYKLDMQEQRNLFTGVHSDHKHKLSNDPNIETFPAATSQGTITIKIDSDKPNNGAYSQ